MFLVMTREQWESHFSGKAIPKRNTPKSESGALDFNENEARVHL
jgi:hypothetical protein